MIDLSASKDNAKMLVERFLETGEQPDFMEFLCFKNFFVEAEFAGYGAEYVVNHFHIYAGIAQKINDIKDSVVGNLHQIEDCYCPCDGRDVIKEAKRYNLEFAMINGHLQFTKSQERETLEVEYDTYSYYSRRSSRVAN